jgi:hypothetical protein
MGTITRHPLTEKEFAIHIKMANFLSDAQTFAVMSEMLYVHLSGCLIEGNRRQT